MARTLTPAQRMERSILTDFRKTLWKPFIAAIKQYELIKEGDKIVGIDAEIAGAIAEKLGLELVIEDMEFDSIIEAVKAGKADIGLAGMTVTEDRLKNINFTDSYCTASQVVIVKK